MKKSISAGMLQVLLLSNYLNVFAFSLFGPLYAVYILQLGANALNLSQLAGVYALVYGLFLLLFGRFQNHLPRKGKIVFTGFLFLSIGAFSYLLIDSLWKAFIVQIVNAVATAWMTPAYKVLYAKSEDVGRESEEWSWVDGGNQILIAVATLVGGLVYSFFGFTVLLICVGCIQLIGALYSYRLIGYKPGVDQ